MDNQQPNTPTPAPVVPSQTPAMVPPPSPVVVKKTPKEMIMLFVDGLKQKKKLLIIPIVIVVLLIVLMVGANLLSRMRNNQAVIVPTPTPEATQPPVTPPPTRYATDSAVLEIEKNVNGLDTELSQVDIDEVNLKPRALQWEVKFE